MSKAPSGVCSILEKAYPVAEVVEETNLLEASILGILLDYAPESRARDALNRIRNGFVDWNEVRVSTGREIAEQAAYKRITAAAGRQIARLLRKLYDDRSELALDFLRGQRQDQIAKYLTGVLELTPNQAAWVFLNGFGKPAIYMTPGVLRVAQRVGLVREEWPEERARKSLERTIPRTKARVFCAAADKHASTVCLANSPRCRKCPLLKVCDYGRSRSKKKTTKRKK